MAASIPTAMPTLLDPNDIPDSLALLLGRIKNEGLAGYLLVDFAFDPAEPADPRLPAGTGPWNITLTYRDSSAPPTASKSPTNPQAATPPQPNPNSTPG